MCVQVIRFRLMTEESSRKNRYRSLRMFPAVKIGLKDGRQYKFIIFGRERFMKCLKEV